MNEFDIIKKYLKPLTKRNPNSLYLEDDIYFDKKNGLGISVDTYVQGVHFIKSNAAIAILSAASFTAIFFILLLKETCKSLSLSNSIRLSTSLQFACLSSTINAAIRLACTCPRRFKNVSF